GVDTGLARGIHILIISASSASLRSPRFAAPNPQRSYKPPPRAPIMPCSGTSNGIPMAQYVYTMNRVGKVVPPKRHILRDISLSFFPGAKIGVLGLNGSGKSTLLRIMAGVDTDIEG